MKNLTEELGLSIHFENERQLELLKNWCLQYVSSDIVFQTSLEDQYLSYYQLAKVYLENFLPFVSANLALEVTEFNHDNAVQFASRKGYDHFLKAQVISQNIINKPTLSGMTPLHLSTIYGHKASVIVLLNKGADVNLLDNKHQLPVQCALFLPFFYTLELAQKKIDIFQILLKRSSKKAMTTDRNGDCILHKLALNEIYAPLISIILAQFPKLALVENQSGHLAIHIAILNNQIDCVRLLLKIPGITNIRDGQGRLPLHYAACYGSTEMIRLFIHNLALLEALDYEGKTPLLLAAQYHHFNTVSYLIKHGAKLEAKDQDGQNIFDYAKEDEVLMEYLQEKSLISTHHSR